MEVEIRKAEKYFLENKEPKELLKNINEMNKNDLHEIVHNFFYKNSLS
jgi:hypothetical protein